MTRTKVGASCLLCSELTPALSGDPVNGICMETCGDGIWLNEECDDSNSVSGDGCSAQCKREDGWDCQSAGGEH